MKQPDVQTDYKVLTLVSPAFKQGEEIPKKYTCDGENISPPLDIKGIPANAKSLVLIVEDPDAPSGTFVHWVSWNIPITHHFYEGVIPGDHGINDFGDKFYGGPCPPSGTHRYFFKLYALDSLIKLPEGSTKSDVEKVMDDHIIGFGELMGHYKRMKS